MAPKTWIFKGFGVCLEPVLVPWKAELRVGSLEAGETREINGSVEASYSNVPQATSMAWINCFGGKLYKVRRFRVSVPNY